MNTIYNLKQELKALARTIRESRTNFRQSQRTAGKDLEDLRRTLEKARSEFRSKHIVRCLLRGRTRDEIEKPGKTPRCKDACYCCNKPFEAYIQKLLLEKQNEIAQEEAHIQYLENQAEVSREIACADKG